MGTTKRTSTKSAAEPKKKKTTTRKRSAAKSTTKKTEKDRLGNARHTLSIIALSPYRFPLDVERVALHTARVGGFAFVLFGMIFTYNYIESRATDLVVEATHTASVSAATPYTSASSAMVNRTPDVNFSYKHRDEDDAYTITMRVPKAEDVVVFAFNPTTGDYERLGPATDRGNSVWEYTWDTRDVPAGNYWIKAIVTNRHGVYDRSDSRYLTVQ